MKSGIIAVWKPKGWTSNDIIRKIKNISGIKKVGHAGTLDPLAEGILVVGLGREATKKLGAELRKEKEYLATIKFGAESSTDDAEGEKTEWPIAKKPLKKEVERAVKIFSGLIKQTPPNYSAIKVKGKRAYKLARAGKKFALKSRPAEIKEIKIVSYRWPNLKLKIVTGPGVYIRSIARDLGRELGVGGYLAGLVRARVGEFTEKEANKRIFMF